MTVLLIGANSFIGRNLGVFLNAQGWRVFGTVRRERHETFRPPWLDKSFILDFAEPIAGCPAEIFRGVDVVIHLAHDFSETMAEMNVRATERIAECAEEAGVPKQVYFSSYSARPDAVSAYAATKYRLEQYFLQKGHVIVRPGLVIGNGGLFLRFLDALRRFPVIPLPDGGRGEIPVISMRQLCVAIHQIMRSPSLPDREINIFYPDLVTMKQLVEAMKSVSGSRALLIPLPSVLLLWAVNLSTALKLKLPFNPDSFRNLIRNQDRIHQANISGLVGRYDSLSDAVRSALPDNDLR